MVINEWLNSTKDCARHIYRHHYMCFIKEMNQTLIASTVKKVLACGKKLPLFVALKEACHRARSLDMEVMEAN
jgi:hypothetical protein